MVTFDVKFVPLVLYCINAKRDLHCMFKSLYIYTLKLFLLEDTEGEGCQRKNMLEIAQKLPK